MLRPCGRLSVRTPVPGPTRIRRTDGIGLSGGQLTRHPVPLHMFRQRFERIPSTWAQTDMPAAARARRPPGRCESAAESSSSAPLQLQALSEIGCQFRELASVCAWFHPYKQIAAHRSTRLGGKPLSTEDFSHPSLQSIPLDNRVSVFRYDNREPGVLIVGVPDEHVERTTRGTCSCLEHRADLLRASKAG